MTREAVATPDVVAAVREVAPAIAESASRIERERTLPPDLVEDLRRTGVFRLTIPRAYGGLEADLAATLDAIEELSAADGSAGWTVMVAATSGIMLAHIDPDEARDIATPDVLLNGVSAPKGQVEPTEGGWRLSGRWPFASGCQLATWLGLGAIVGDDVRMLLVPASEIDVVDTWDTSGLRGTGSHDVTVDGAVVPEGRSFSFTAGRPVVEGPLFRFPLFGLLALGVASVAVGIARGAIEDLVALAGAKRPEGSRRTLAERAAAQADVARAEALRASARAHLHAAVHDAWTSAQQGPLTIEERARLRLAATHAARSCADAVDICYDAGGGSSLYAQNPLQRRFRDVHTLTQHIMVAPATYELVGRLRFGLDTDTTFL